MDGLLTADNLPIIIGIVLSATVLNFLKDMVAAIRAWRKGASEKERNILLDTLKQLERCNSDRDRAQDERDTYRQRVGRRDYLLLSHGIEPPHDEHGEVTIDDSDSRSSGSTETT